MAPDEVITDEPRMVLAYFDGDLPVFRPAEPEADGAYLADDDDEIPGASFSAPIISRNIGFEIEDDEPVYRSLGSLAISNSPSRDLAPAPPSLCRQRGFGQPDMLR